MMMIFMMIRSHVDDDAVGDLMWSVPSNDDDDDDCD